MTKDASFGHIEGGITDYQAKYFAYELTKRCAPDSAERLAGAVAGAQVDLNPHQVDAALFAFSSPLSKGAFHAELLDANDYDTVLQRGGVHSADWAIARRDADRLYEGVAATAERHVAAQRIVDRADAATLALDLSRGNQSAAALRSAREVTRSCSLRIPAQTSH